MREVLGSISNSHDPASNQLDSGATQGAGWKAGYGRKASLRFITPRSALLFLLPVVATCWLRLPTGLLAWLRAGTSRWSIRHQAIKGLSASIRLRFTLRLPAIDSGNKPRARLLPLALLEPLASTLGVLFGWLVRTSTPL